MRYTYTDWLRDNKRKEIKNSNVSSIDLQHTINKETMNQKKVITKAPSNKKTKSEFKQAKEIVEKAPEIKIIPDEEKTEEIKFHDKER